MSELGIIAYGWYTAVDNPKRDRNTGVRYAVPYKLLCFFTDVTTDLLEVSDESLVMVPWRTMDDEIQKLHPEHRALFWENRTVIEFRGKKLVAPSRQVLLARGEYCRFFVGGKEAAAWAETPEEARKLIEIALR